MLKIVYFQKVMSKLKQVDKSYYKFFLITLDCNTLSTKLCQLIITSIPSFSIPYDYFINKSQIIPFCLWPFHTCYSYPSVSIVSSTGHATRTFAYRCCCPWTRAVWCSGCYSWPRRGGSSWCSSSTWRPRWSPATQSSSNFVSLSPVPYWWYSGSLLRRLIEKASIVQPEWKRWES